MDRQYFFLKKKIIAFEEVEETIYDDEDKVKA